MEMVSTLHMFTRSIRDANCDLYLCSVTKMQPYIAHYDHTNYFRCMSVYMSEMHNIPAEVEKSFREGDFVVKRSNQKCNQVDADHGQEWIVGVSKNACRIVGIANSEAALQRWALSFHWRTDIAQ